MALVGLAFFFNSLVITKLTSAGCWL